MSTPLFCGGHLESVSNLQAACNENSILLSWSPPFSLDVTGVDPDIWYTVLISNVTDEDNPTAVPCTDCHNLTQPHYTFTSDTQSQNPCSVSLYSFEIIPVNAAGEGHHTPPLTLGFAGGKQACRGVLSSLHNLLCCSVDIAIETEVEVQFTPSATLKIYIWVLCEICGWNFVLLCNYDVIVVVLTLCYVHTAPSL